MLFPDYAGFTREVTFNRHNSHVWAEANPHAAPVHCHQQRFFLMNVWAGIVNDFLIGPYLLPRRLSEHRFTVCVSGGKVLEMLEEIPLSVRRNVWLQHDGAAAHCALQIR
jgi:5-methylcytosine-specific restriction endonuclease McrA